MIKGKTYPREYLGEVVFTSGDKVKVYMPTIGDITELKSDMNAYEITYRMCAAAVSMSYEQFCLLSLIDGSKVAGKINHALEIICKLGRD